MLVTKVKESELHIGDSVRVHTTVMEGTKSRIQIFEGLVIRISGRGENQTFTVRRVGAGGIGVERIWPVNGRSIVKVEVTKKSKNVRRSKLYYLRNLTGQAATRV